MKPRTLDIPTKRYALFKPGGRVLRGYAHGKLTEIRYLDVVPVGEESSDRDDLIQQVQQMQLAYEELDELRIGYVDEKNVGIFYDWQEFLDSKSQPAEAPVWRS